MPLVDELAADIFMGGFTAKFVRAAEITARRLEDTLYARYYELPIAEVRAIATSAPPPAPGPIPAFGALADGGARTGPRRVSRAQRSHHRAAADLTTQNLVPLIDAAQLTADRFPALALRSFEWLIRRVQVKVSRRMERLRTAKNAAYAWRQAIVYLSLSPRGATDDFLMKARAHLSEQRAPFRARFEPLLAGLESAHAGQSPGLRLLGWSTGAHPLVEP